MLTNTNLKLKHVKMIRKMFEREVNNSNQTNLFKDIEEIKFIQPSYSYKIIMKKGDSFLIHWYEFITTYLVEAVICKPISYFGNEPVFSRTLHEELSNFFSNNINYFWELNNICKPKHGTIHPVEYLFKIFSNDKKRT